MGLDQSCLHCLSRDTQSWVAALLRHGIDPGTRHQREILMGPVLHDETIHSRKGDPRLQEQKERHEKV